MYNIQVRMESDVWDFVFTDGIFWFTGYIILNFKEIAKNKKFKNILITLCEILVVAGIIFGALMFIQNKVSKEADKLSGVDKTVGSKEAETKKVDSGSDKYYIEVNIKKSAMIVYQYSSDKKTKKPYKIFKCSVGSDLKKGEYKTSESYSWIDVNGSWHRYNTQIGTKAWIQSAGYKDKYANALKKSSYKAIGDKESSGSCIMLYAKDAQWVSTKCKSGTVVNVVKGKTSDQLPLNFEQTVNPYKYCGWDPTDPDKDNPYHKVANSSIAIGSETVYVEKGQDVDYVGNLLAKDETGKNITGLLKYKKINSGELGTHKVKFSYEMKDGKKITATQKFVVVDTTCPVVTCSKKKFTYEVKSLDKVDMNKKSNVTDIEKLVRASVSCNESDVTITVNTLEAKELREGMIPVVVKAQDKSGNVGSCQVMCEIKVEKAQKGKQFNPSKSQKEKLEKQRKKNQKETTKKQSDKKEKVTEKATTKKASEEEITTVKE